MKVGSLCTGYGGLDLAVGGEVEWVSDVDPSACRILENAFPFVPNLGDLTAVDWSTVPPVDVITAGYPCQPFSLAGLRKGTDDERHLWPFIADAVRTIRPRYVVLENVRGHVSMGLDVVLSDLARMGMSARWATVRASDAGACHERARLFILAESADPGGAGLEGSGQTVPGGRSRATGGDTPPDGRASAADADGVRGSGLRPRDVAGAGRGSRVEGPPGGGGQSRIGSQDDDDEIRPHTFGPYEPAVARWERVTGRNAPAPTVRVKGVDRLNPRFVEWMQGLPDGWVTGHGLTRGQAIRCLGNGVVPQQARLALDLLGYPS